MIYSYLSLPCPVRGSHFTNSTSPSVLHLHFDQVSSHFANSIPILLLPIDNLLDAMMNEKELY